MKSPLLLLCCPILAKYLGLLENRHRGYDGAKRLSGRKRHILVDSMGLLLRVVVHPANIQDRTGAMLLLDKIKERFPRLSLIRADQGYTGPTLKKWIEEHFGCSLQIIQKPRRWGRYPEGVESPPMPVFQILPYRWVVERTFAWEGRNRRLSKDYEGLPISEESFIYLAMVRLMLRRLIQ